MADMQDARRPAAPGQQNSVKKLTNLAGAAVSMALIAGVGIWGYKIMVRDVSGVPVVRAAEGPMRIQPDDPGGRQAVNQGLAVNRVAAEGTAAKPADRLILAPKPLELSLEDTPAQQTARSEAAASPDAPEVTPGAEAGDAALANRDGVQLAAVEALATQLSAGASPIETNEDTAVEPAESPQDNAAANEAEAPRQAEKPEQADKPEKGLHRSLRPQVRPAALSTRQKPAEAAAQSDAPRDVDPASIPAGTRMAQLGAFESAAIAEQEWTRLSGRFSEYLEDKDRVVQKAQSGGRTFYRLRAMGFADLSDARRFCSALVAENADCIPVVTR